MKILLAIIFFNALGSSVYFLGNILAWMTWKIRPETSTRIYTNRDILRANLTMIYSILCWTIIYYFSL